MLRTIVNSSFRGRYPGVTEGYLRNHPELYDNGYIVAQSFGTYEEGLQSGRVNSLLAGLAMHWQEVTGLPIYAQEEVASALPEGFSGLTIFGDPSSTSGRGLDTWGVLNRASGIASDRGGDRSRSVIVTHSHLMGRVAAQAALLGMKPVLPDGMPREFAPDSKQWWTRSRLAWIARESVGLWTLKCQGRL